MSSSDKKKNHFLLLYPDNISSESTIYLTESIYSIGRHSDNNIKLNSGVVSRHHATLIRKDLATGEYSYILIDGDLKGKRSQNGILVNGKKIIQHQLKDNDVIIFGTSQIKAIYQQENVFSEDLIGGNLSSKQLQKKSISSSDFSREKLQETLIVSEENLSENLSNKDIKRLASFPELSPNPIIEFDFDGTIIYTNPAANLSFGEMLTDDSLIGLLTGGLNNNENKISKELIVREIKIKNKYFEQYIHYLSKENVIRSYIFDITRRKESEAKLEYQAFHDSLTGIPNRDFFYWKLALSLAEIKEKQKQLAILFIDIDRFKNINDTLNHTVGDKLLENFSQRLTSCLPFECFLARWGGDEFTVFVPLDNEFSNPSNIAELIINSLKEPFLIEKYTIYITCSIGISLYPEDGLNEEELIKYADIALFRAKQTGKNNCKFYTSKLSQEQTFLFELENTLYNALENQELFLTFQPQLDLKTNQISGVEVLLRWENPKLGMIPPITFIPLAEETGLILSIGKWVLETACVYGKKWHDLGYENLIVAVNVSAKQFLQEDFIQQVKNILDTTKFNPFYLELEITESILMQEVKRTEFIINELSSLGVKFSLDDFGTGYSSFSYLKKFPFHIVKIDQSFICDLVSNKQDQALVSAIITLSRGYNMMVVAEGVETENQKLFLKNIECDFIQGWLLSKPLIEEDLFAFLNKHKNDN